MRGRTLTPAEIDATRAHLVACALAILETEGREACSLRRVAAEAGLSRGTPYTYFADKEALLDAARVAALHALADACEAACAPHADIPGRLAAVGQSYLRFALERPQLYALIFEPNGGSVAQQAAVQRYQAIARAPLHEAEALGWLRLPADRVAGALWAATHGLIALARAGKIPAGKEFEAMRADLADILAFGFTSAAVPR